VFVSEVQLVITLRGLFCTDCSFWMLVTNAVDHHMVLTYSITGRVGVLYVARSVCFCLPQDVEVGALIIIFKEDSAFSL
jgi:hypothetical protein